VNARWMRATAVAVLLGSLLAVIAVRAAKAPVRDDRGVERNIQEMIVLDTPKFKDRGAESRVTFTHLRHARRSKCRVCHDTLKPQLHSPQNSTFLVHRVCYDCHRRKGVETRQFSCTDCHSAR